jgi:hypothetical protein
MPKSHIRLSPPLPQLGVDEEFCWFWFWFCGCPVLDAMLFMFNALLARAPIPGGSVMLKPPPVLGGGATLNECADLIGGGAMLNAEKGLLCCACDCAGGEVIEKFDVPELLHGFELSEGVPPALLQSTPELWLV